jgi:ribosome recycling factor
MTVDILKDLELKNSELIKHFKEQLAGIRGGRPTTKLVENIAVDYLGQKLLVKQLGSISVVLPRELQILVWDAAAVQSVVKAVESVLNVKANTENNLIRLSLPPLSEERRLELIKLIKKEAEEARIRMRAFRDEALKKIKQQEERKELTEDDRYRLKDEVQKNVDTINNEIDKILENKIREISE